MVAGEAESDVSQIHPITLRYAGAEPCVPIRLTRIAAQDDMEIRALFLDHLFKADHNLGCLHRVRPRSNP